MGGGVTFNGAPLSNDTDLVVGGEGSDSEKVWVTYETPKNKGKVGLRLVQERKPGKGRKARKGRKAKRGKPKGNNHKFSVMHDEEFHEVTIEVQQFAENLNLVIEMHNVGFNEGEFHGHCGNFNGDPADDDANPQEWNAMVGEQDLMFEPKVWDVVKPAGIECDDRTKQLAWSFCEKKQQVLAKEAAEADDDDDGEPEEPTVASWDLDDCVVDYCGSDLAIAEGGLETDRVRRKRNKNTRKEKCAARWGQAGSWDTDNDIKDGKEVPMVKSSNKCAKQCKQDRTIDCKSYTFAREGKQTTCVLHTSDTSTSSKGKNQVLCIKPTKDVEKRKGKGKKSKSKKERKDKKNKKNKKPKKGGKDTKSKK